MENLKFNSKEVVRVFQCSSELMFNLTISKITLLSKPFQSAMRETASNLTQIQDSLDMITDVVRPLTNEIETPFQEDDTDEENVPAESRFVRTLNETDGKLFRQRYVAKINDRCKSQMMSGMYGLLVLYGRPALNLKF